MFPTRRITTGGGDVFRDEFSLAFDGTNDFVQLPMPINYSAVTISAWVKVTEDSNAKVIVGGRDSGSDGLAFFINSSERLTLKVNGNNTSAADMDITPNVWTHVVGTYDGDIAKTYINGVFGKQIDISTDGITTVTTNARIGINAFDTSNPYNGNISEVVIYNKALSASEIKTLYNGREPYNHKEGVCSSNLQAWYRMGDGILDSKQNHNIHTGIVCDETNPTLGADLLGGKGDFSDASYWQTHSGQSIVEDGVGKFLGNGLYNAINKSGILTVGKMYRCQLDCTSNSGTSIATNQSTYHPQIITTGLTGTHFAFFQAGQTSFALFAPTNSYGETAIIDNVIVQEVNGNVGNLKNIATKSCFEGDTP